MFTAITFLRAWNSASEVASWPDLKDVVLWFRHLPCVVMSLPCSVILDIGASHCWRIKSEFYKLPSEYLLFSFSHPSHALKHLFLFLGGALYIFSPLFLHMLFISFCLKCFFFFFSVFSFPLQTLTWKLHTHASWPRSNFISSIKPSQGGLIYFLAGRNKLPEHSKQTSLVTFLIL